MGVRLGRGVGFGPGDERLLGGFCVQVNLASQGLHDFHDHIEGLPGGRAGGLRQILGTDTENHPPLRVILQLGRFVRGNF